MPRDSVADWGVKQLSNRWVNCSQSELGPDSGELTGSSLDVLPVSTALDCNTTCWSNLLWALSCMNSALLQCYINGSLNFFYKHNHFYSVNTCTHCCTVLCCSATKPGLSGRTSLGNTFGAYVLHHASSRLWWAGQLTTSHSGLVAPLRAATLQQVHRESINHSFWCNWEVCFETLLAICQCKRKQGRRPSITQTNWGEAKLTIPKIIDIELPSLLGYFNVF